MINNYKDTNSSTIKAKDNLTTPTIKKKTTRTKKTKNKIPRATIQTKQLKFSCYQDLCTRNATKNTDADRSINSFITRINIKDQSFEQENYNKCIYLIAFPTKSNKDYIPNELNGIYERLARLSITIKNTIYEVNCKIYFDEILIEDFIMDLISIKQEIIEIWKKYNPTTPYKYGNLQNNGEMILEDEMLDFVQAQLFNCYHAINDHRNLELIINQLIEQSSIICTDLLIIIYFSNISNYHKADKLNFKDILIQATELEKSYSKVEHGKKHNYQNRHNSNNQLSIIASLIRLFLNNTCIDYSKINIDNMLSNLFSNLVGEFANYYSTNYNHTEKIKKLSLGITFYFSKLDDPILNGIHTTLLTTNSMIFIEKFSSLIAKLKTINCKHANFIASTQKNKNKLLFGIDLDTHNRIYSTEINTVQQQIKQLFTKYHITTDDIDSWYDTFIKDGFSEIFFTPANLIVTLAEWIDLSKKTETKQQASAKKSDNIHSWLDILVNKYKKLSDDQIEWNDIPIILLFTLNNQMAGESIRLTFGTPEIAKQEDLAILYAKTAQVFNPFLGTALLAIANKDSYDALLTDLDMLELISQQTGKTKYIKSSKYLMAQIITYLINQNNKLDLVKKQLLFAKAEKLYLELASSGINQAYLLLSETIASLAKTKMYEQNFLEAADLYYQASSYCKTLSEVNNLEINLQDLALTSMNCFSSEADVLRKINEEQAVLLQELTTPKTTTKNKKKSQKQTDNIPTEIDNQDPDTEITITELITWHQIYKKPITKTQNAKAFPAKKIKDITKLPSRDEIDTRRNFWLTTKKLLASSVNLTTSYTLLIKLINNNYYKILELQFKDGITQNDNWVVLLVYQKMAYYHFLQLKYALEIGNSGNNLKLFYVAKSKTPATSKANKITFNNISDEVELLIHNAIKLICVETINIETKDFREIFLSLSPSIYKSLLPIYKSQLASLTSTYGHLKSLDDIAQGRRGKARLSAALYDKADEINPDRIIRKQKKQAS